MIRLTEANTEQGAETVTGGIITINASDNSVELDRFLDLINNPCNYKGRVVYLTAVGPTERPDPFLWANKFYFNEGCAWHESPFSIDIPVEDTTPIPITPTPSGTGETSIISLDASDNSPDLALFLDMINNPCNYNGRVAYLTAIGPTERPDPFLWADKFYFNEGCQWYESPFSFRADEIE